MNPGQEAFSSCICDATHRVPRDLHLTCEGVLMTILWFLKIHGVLYHSISNFLFSLIILQLCVARRIS